MDGVDPNAPMDGAGEMEGGKRRSRWMAHVKKTMRAHKGKSLSQVLKMAKKTYKKTRRGGNTEVPPPKEEDVIATGGSAKAGNLYGTVKTGGYSLASAHPVGGRRRRGSRKGSKKGSRRH